MKKFAATKGKRYLSLLLTLCLLMGLATSLVVPASAQETDEVVVEHHHADECEIDHASENSIMFLGDAVQDVNEPVVEYHHSDICTIDHSSESATPNFSDEISANVLESTQAGSGLVGAGTYATTYQGMCFHSNSLNSFAEAFNYYGPNYWGGGDGYGGHSGGSAIVGQRIGDNILPPAGRAGYTFLGWYTSPQGACTHAGAARSTNYVTSFGTQYTADSIMPNQHLILYARWQKMPVASPNSHLCFHTNGGGVIKYNYINNSGIGSHSGLDAVPHGARLGEHIAWARSGFYNDSQQFPIAVRSGYNFLGWYTSPEGGCATDANYFAAFDLGIHQTTPIWEVSTYGTEYTANSTMPNHNLILYARWEKIVPNYNVTYYANFPAGTTGSPGSTTRSTPEYSILSYTDVFGSATPSASGKSYSFKGWYTAANGGSQVTSVTGNQTVYAQWNETNTSYGIIFLANFPSGTGTSPTASETLASGASMPEYGNVFSTSPSAVGKTYTFKGWYTATTGGTQIISVTESQIVYAQWTEGVASYDVVYNANFPSGTGSQPTNKTERQEHNASVKAYDSVFASKPTASGETYTFNGWFTSATGGTEVTTITNGQTVHAQWTQGFSIRTITYHANGGTGTAPLAHTGASNVSVTLASGSGLSRSGHVFAGWLAAEEGNAPSVIPADGAAPAGLMAAGSSYTSNKDMILYAVWAVDSDNDGGGDYLQKRVVYKSGDLKANLSFTVLLNSAATEFTTELCPPEWNNNALTKFDGWGKKNSSDVFSVNKVVAWVADEAGGKTMTLTAVAVSAGNKTAESISVALADPSQQRYTIGDTLHGKGVTVTVTYRDGTTEPYITPAEISAAGITLKTVNGKNIGDALGLADDGQALIASKNLLTSDPSTGTIEVGENQHTITVLVMGASNDMTDLIRIRDKDNAVIGQTGSWLKLSGNDGETYTISQNPLHNGTNYPLQSFVVDGVDCTTAFAVEGSYTFTLTSNTTIAVAYHHEAEDGMYNVYADILSGVGTGELGVRRASNPHATPSDTIFAMIKLWPTKMVAENMHVSDHGISVLLRPGSGYRVGSVYLNGDFIFAGDAQWVDGGGNDVIIKLPADSYGDIISDSYYLLVNYVKFDPGVTPMYSVTIASKTMDADNNEISSLDTDNRVTVGGLPYNELGYTDPNNGIVRFSEGSSVQFGAKAGAGYKIGSITLDGVPIAAGEVDYALMLGNLGSDHEIVVTFVEKDAADISVLEPEDQILRGAWADESSGDVTFWISSDGKAIVQSELNALTFEYAEAFSWVGMPEKPHAIGGPVLTGNTKIEGTKTYAEVRVPVTAVRYSAVGSVLLKSGETTLSIAYIITPGDTTKDRKLNSSDLRTLSLVVNRESELPDPDGGANDEFTFKMMDMNKDGKINSADVRALGLIINGDAVIKKAP